MNNPLGILLLVVGAIAVIYLIVKVAQIMAERERQRLAGLAYWASANGFEFAATDMWDLDSRFNGIADIGTGHDRYAYEVMARNEPVPAFIFRYHYKTWETRTVTRSDGRTTTETYEENHERHYLVLETGARFPQLFIRPERLWDKMASMVGFDDINFESEAFSRRYFCKSADRQFAYAVIHAQMMEWMMDRQWEGELRDGLLIMAIDRFPHTGEGCARAWECVVGFINRIPTFVWKDYAGRAQLTLPEPVAPPVAAAVPAA